MDSDHEDTGSRRHMQVNILGLTASDANGCHSANLVKLKDTSSELWHVACGVWRVGAAVHRGCWFRVCGLIEAMIADCRR